MEDLREFPEVFGCRRNMIVGNPKAGRRIAGAAIAVLLVMCIITLVVTLRKKQSPTQEPPILHPSTLVVHARFQYGNS